MFNKIKLRHTFAQLVYFYYRCLPFFRSGKKKITTINYHFFTEGAISDESLEVSLDVAEEQIKILRKNYEVLSSPQKMKAFFEGKEKKFKPKVLLTVDDADKNFTLLLPILEKYQIPVTLFVPVGFCLSQRNIDGLRSRCLHFYMNKSVESGEERTTQRLNDFFRSTMEADETTLTNLLHELKSSGKNKEPMTMRELLCTEEIEELAGNPLVTISSHSMSHLRLSTLPPEWVEWEVSKSIDYIGQWGGDTSTFAYPYGNKESYNASTEKILRENKIQYAFVNIPQSINGESNSLSLGRSFFLNYSDKPYVIGTAKGAFEIFDRLLGRS